MNRNGLNNAKNGLGRNLPTAVNRVGNAAMNGAVNTIKNAANGAVNTLNAAANGAANTFKTAANEVGEVMANAPTAVNTALGGIPEKIGNVVNNATAGLASAANNMTNYLNNTTNKVLNTVGLGNNTGNNTGNNSNKNYLSNSAKNNSLKNNSTVNFLANSFGNSVGEEAGFFGSVWFFILIALLAIVGVFIFFFDQIMELLPQSMRDALNRLRAAFGIPVEPTPAPAPVPEQPPAPEEPAILPGVPTPAYLPDSGVPQTPDITNIPGIAEIINKQLPSHKKEVFNIKENRYRYEDAEPLCNALGAELATYEQVKEAYEHGADWCNYGWVKGQQAVYPTQEATYEKLQAGPKEQRQACGKPGINGGYFDNPDLRFGVTCYGVKPGQKEHDKSLLPNGEANPFSPDALEYDKRVAEFKADSQNIGILPFSQGRWDEA